MKKVYFVKLAILMCLTDAIYATETSIDTSKDSKISKSKSAEATSSKEKTNESSHEKGNNKSHSSETSKSDRSSSEKSKEKSNGGGSSTHAKLSQAIPVTMLQTFPFDIINVDLRTRLENSANNFNKLVYSEAKAYRLGSNMTNEDFYHFLPKACGSNEVMGAVIDMVMPETNWSNQAAPMTVIICDGEGLIRKRTRFYCHDNICDPYVLSNTNGFNQEDMECQQSAIHSQCRFVGGLTGQSNFSSDNGGSMRYDLFQKATKTKISIDGINPAFKMEMGGFIVAGQGMGEHGAGEEIIRPIQNFTATLNSTTANIKLVNRNLTDVYYAGLKQSENTTTAAQMRVLQNEIYLSLKFTKEFLDDSSKKELMSKDEFELRLKRYVLSAFVAEAHKQRLDAANARDTLSRLNIHGFENKIDTVDIFGAVNYNDEMHKVLRPGLVVFDRDKGEIFGSSYNLSFESDESVEDRWSEVSRDSKTKEFAKTINDTAEYFERNGDSTTARAVKSMALKVSNSKDFEKRQSQVQKAQSPMDIVKELY